ncbi:MAG: glycosyltransferase family 4 protein [Muribaculaceae bacterium]|nr:glycosyltransferase family 4 protein [Muribaculaceae bacterium]MBR6431273.1 glycosyltransferase family 4 protein [Muribaculaceae bacterium]
MKIVVIGTRGIPDIQGGVETHCEELYPRLVALGCDVTIIRRSCYVTDDNRISEYKGVKLIDVYAPRRKSTEAFIHTTLALMKASKLKPDIVHIHAIGPALCTPLAKMMGFKVVSTNHGPDYDRQKWGRMAKAALKLGEKQQARYSNHIIAISHVIVDILKRRYNRFKNVSIIYNGVNSPVKSTATDYIESLGLQPGKYIMTMGRIVPEKRFDWLIEAFQRARFNGYKLVIVGDSDHNDMYSNQFKKMARDNDNVVLTGFIKGEKLNQVLTNAALFVLPSTHEGLPISLLEAMSYNLDVLVSDIPANRLPELDHSDFFTVDSISSLTKFLSRKMRKPQKGRKYDLANYNWDNIAKQTLDVYRQVLKK